MPGLLKFTILSTILHSLCARDLSVIPVSLYTGNCNLYTNNTRGTFVMYVVLCDNQHNTTDTYMYILV